jgi:diguanylate cyclase (GGDEF)-like protein
MLGDRLADRPSPVRTGTKRCSTPRVGPSILSHVSEAAAQTRAESEDAAVEPVPNLFVDARQRNLLQRLRYLIYGSFAVLVLSVLVVLLRSPTDLLALLQALALLALGGALIARYMLSRRLTDRQIEREAGQTRILQGMSRSASSDAIVETIVDELRRAADADHIVVARLRPVERVVETTLVSSRALVPPARSILPAGVLDPPGSTGAKSRSRRRPQVLGGRDAFGGDEAQRVAESLAARLGETYALSHTLSAPLVTKGRVVGAVILSRRQRREWTLADRRLLAFSAEELSAALGRAFAFEDAEIKANIDALTGLPNRRYLEELLATVGPRRRSGDRLGALMIDLDHFKNLNDRYGHAAGDRVLHAVGERISSAVRADDTPARYGGEEFAVLLRRADPKQAVEVAERIREQIGSMSSDELGVNERVTVSIGVAVADSHVTDPTSLLAAADAALYRAKREGRNRVIQAPTN